MECTTAVLQKPVVLLGIKHCGKSTHGKLLAKKCGCAFYDIDDEILTLTGKTPRTLYTESPEVFMQAEYETCVALIKKIGDAPCVISSGGGICNNEKALTILHEHCVFVFIAVTEELPSQRIIHEASADGYGGFTNLPAYIAKENPHSLDEIRASFHRFFIDRCKKYQEITDYTVSLGLHSKTDNNAMLVKALCDFRLIIVST
ncbi:MAG: hypothetical protein K6E51_05955 [Treponema sp.]|nr:hypothetical protein [Treponema sp.]